MKSSEFITESKKRCPQCGMTNCTCAPGKCKCKPVAGWIPNKGFQKAAKQDVTEGSQRVDSLVTDALRVMKGPEMSDAVLALKRVLGDRAYNERRGFYRFYVDQIHDMYGQQDVSEVKQRLDPKCWTGKHKEGTKIKGGIRVNNCVPNESITEDLDADQQFDLIEDMVMELAEAHGVDADQIWEDFESVDDHLLIKSGKTLNQ